MKLLIPNPNDLALKLIQNKVDDLKQRIGLPGTCTQTGRTLGRQFCQVPRRMRIFNA